MATDRRQFLQGVIASVGGATLLAACTTEPHVVVTDLVNAEGRFFTSEEIKLISRISDLLIPRTHTPGALDVRVPAFLDGLMADWASEKTRENNRRTIAELKTELDLLVGGDFATTELTKAETVLAEFDRKAFAEGTGVAGYRGLKKLIAIIYFNSEDGSSLELDYQPVPGYWDPCVQIKNT